MEKKYSAEVYLINSLIRSKSYQTVVAYGLSSEMFIGYQEEMEWIERFFASWHTTPTKDALLERYPEFPWHKYSSHEELSHWCMEVKRDFRQNSLVRLVSEAAQRLHDDRDDEDISQEVLQLLDSGVGEIKKVAGGMNAAFEVTNDWESIFDTFLDKVERAELSKNGVSGIPTGLKTLDLVTGGFQPGWFVVLAARLGAGKTYSAIRMAFEAWSAGKSVTYFSLEQSRYQIAARLYGLASKRYYHQIFNPHSLSTGLGVDVMEFKKFLLALKNNDALGRFNIDDTSRGKVTPDSISAVIQARQPDIVFIDYLTLLTNTADDWRGVAKNSADIQGIAQRFNIPVVGLSQVNRIAGSEMPGPEHLSQSDAIGQDADMMIGLRKLSKHCMEWGIGKYRHGEGGQKWKTHFDPSLGIYDEVSELEANQVIERDRAYEDAAAELD